jgi:F-type H+-transporting ATPase subunit b
MVTTFLLAAGMGDELSKTAAEIGLKFGFNKQIFFSQIISFLIVAILLQKFAFKPILAILEERRKRIAEGLLNAEKIKSQLAESEKRYQEILSKANVEAQRVIDEALATAGSLGEKERQRAISDAEQIIAKAREATAQEHSQMLGQLKRELGRLVIDTTSKVTGKVLTAEDQQRLTEESTRGVTVG